MKFIQFALFLSFSSYVFSLEESQSEILEKNTKELVELNVLSFEQSQSFQDIASSKSMFVPSMSKKSWLAVGLSALMPGLGHVYLGDMQTAGGLMGSVALGIGVQTSIKKQEFVDSTSALTIQTTWLYGMYATYRDVYLRNGMKNYAYQMPTDTFLDLTAAPFRLQVLKKMEVWGGLLGSLVLAVAAAYLAFPEEQQIRPFLSLTRMLSPLTALPIGIGEEAFFRGFLQSQIAQWTNPWGGIVFSSLAFGASHMPNAWDLPTRERRAYYRVIVPFITLSGIYDGWLTYKNRSLQSSVAIHAWYDFTLFAISSLAGQVIGKKYSDLFIEIPF